MNTLHMQKNQGPGRLFTFCGLDGCGKTTMIRRVAAALEGEYAVTITRQPTDSVRRSAIFRTYMDCEDHSAYDYRSLSLLAASDRLQHGREVIEPTLKNGGIVLSDRYFYSCLANLRARGLTGDRWIYEIAEAVVRPDAAFFFDLPVETAVERVRRRAAERDRYIDRELQYRLREEYRRICRENGGVLLSTEEKPDETFRRVMEVIREALPRREAVFEKVSAVLRRLSGQEHIAPMQMLQGDLGLDSLGMVTLLIELEDAFGITLREADMNPFRLVRVIDVCELMNRYTGGAL